MCMAARQGCISLPRSGCFRVFSRLGIMAVRNGALSHSPTLLIGQETGLVERGGESEEFPAQGSEASGSGTGGNVR